ncbi:MAG: carboxypeptidase-like regulatory domain-containing protein [Anaerolineae bacterium]
MRIRLATVTAILVLLTTTAGAWAQGSGEIKGQVFDGSSGGGPLEGLPVTLWLFTGQGAESSLETTTDAEGRFRFEGLDTEGYGYQFEVEYVGVKYGSEVMAFPEGEDLISIPFTVFESTTSDEDLSVERTHLIFDFEPGTIQVQEVQIFFNAGNTTYVGPTGEEGATTAHFTLPEGASAVQLMDGLMECCVVETDTGFASTRPIYPGSRQFVFTYELRHQSTTYDLPREIAYPIGSLDVLIADVGVEVEASGLTSQESLSVEGGDYLHLTAHDLTSADQVVLRFASLPLEVAPTESAATAPTVPTWAVLGLAILAVFVALAYPFFKRSREEKG